MTLERIELLRYFAEERRQINNIKDQALRMACELKHLAEMNAKIKNITEEDKIFYLFFQQPLSTRIYLVDSYLGGKDA